MDDLDDILAELDAAPAAPKKKYSWMNSRNQMFPPPPAKNNTSNLLDILDEEEKSSLPSFLKNKKSGSMDLGYNDDFEDESDSPRPMPRNPKVKSPAFKKPSKKDFMSTEVEVIKSVDETTKS